MADGFDPRFGGPLDQLVAAANAQGIKTKVISGVRNAEDQRQLYANYLAGLNKQPLPYPARGAVPLAAKPGTSLHERGLAADVQAENPDDQPKLWAMAPQFGLKALGSSDPGHFQVGGATPAVNNRVAGGAPATINPGLTVNSSPLAGSHAQFIMDYAKSIGLDPNVALGVANAEGLKAWSAKNPNAGSSVDVGPDGKPFSYGDFQLNVRNGMGNQAIAKGIDPRDGTQWQAADRFALDQMKAGGLDPWKGDAYVKAMRSGQAPGPIDPSIIARGGTSPAIPDTPGTSISSIPGVGADQSKALMGGLSTLDKAMGGKGIGGDKGGEEPQMQPMGPSPPIRNMSNPAAFASALYGNTLTSMRTPIQWGEASPGQNPYANVGGQGLGQQFGTQLGSLQQMQQMMAMMGSPYGDTGYG